MSVLKPRNRLVYFRVSEDEYEQFSHICESTGSRSISDLARLAMQNMIDKGNGDQDEFSEKLTVLQAMISDLTRKVHQLSISLHWATSQGQDPASESRPSVPSPGAVEVGQI